MTKTTAQTPAETVAARLRELRELEELTQQDLADRLAKLGYDKLGRGVIAKIEMGDPERVRGIGVNETFAFALALHVSPLALMTPYDDAPLQIAPRVALSPADARAWVRHRTPAPGQDTGWFYDQLPPEERDRVYAIANEQIERAEVQETMLRAIDILRGQWAEQGYGVTDPLAITRGES
jgi:transcriptional regulator with XRE-family HTH domain